MKFRGSAENIPHANALAIGLNRENSEVILALMSPKLPLGGLVLSPVELLELIGDLLDVARDMGLTFGTDKPVIQ